MRLTRATVAWLVVVCCVGAARPGAAQSDPATIDLIVPAGRPIRVSLDDRVRLERVGQPITGTVTEPVYAYDRVVIPAGARVRGHIAQIESASKLVRARAYASGNFSPPKHAVLQFDTLVVDDGHDLPIATIVKGGIPHVERKVAKGADADESSSSSLVSRTKSDMKHKAAEEVGQVKQKAHEAFASIRSLHEPGGMQKLKDAAVQQLPYHPQYIAKGTVYDAELSAPLTFGRAEPIVAAPDGSLPAPDSILRAKLATTLDSAKTPRGTPFEAVLTEPVFSGDHQVVLPEGTKLTGEVTLATPARRFHRNGQLRFLFERVEVPGHAPAPLLGELHSVEANADDHVAVDEEGGTTLENSKTRFIAPALSILALTASVHRDGERHPDPDGDGTYRTESNGVGARGVGGFIGMSAIGSVTSMLTRPFGIAITAYGAARSVYANVLAKGREVTFAADTPIEVRLAPVVPSR